MRPDPAVPARQWMRRGWPWLAALALAVAGVTTFDAWLASCGFTGCPSRTEIRAFRPPEGGRILDRSGRFIGRIKTVRRVNVPLAQVPAYVRQAFIATEDRRFYRHGGLDWRGFARAAARNVGHLGVREGFSTITMQVARNTFIDQHWAADRTIKRKLVELRLARLIERALTKDQILELYLNVIYLGNGVYGVEAASLDLFGKHVKDLSVAEGAVLAALPKGPSAYTPRNNPRRALQRRDLVLDLMRDQRYIDDATARNAKEQRIAVADQEWRPVQPDDSYALDAVRAVIDSVMRAMGSTEPELVVYTTLDLAAQRAADRAVRRRAASIEREAYGGRGRIEGAMVALDPRTGDVRAMVGGRTYTRGRFNRALFAKRQPGSAFKPFVYEAALAAGYSPASMVEDEPIEVQQGRKIWTPANYGGKYLGRVTFRDALMHSANAATVRVSRAVGEQSVIDAARRNGITSPLQPVPAIALGALEVTPMEIVTAYAPFANGGFRVRPRIVRRIEAPDGTVLWSNDSTARAAVMDPRDAYELTAMLRSVVDYGTGTAIRAAGVTNAVAGKTGTTNNGADVWFIGYTPSLVAGFWFGFDQPRQISGDASGGRLAAPAWADFYLSGWKERASDRGWKPPAGMVPAVIDPQSGLLAGEYCPTAQREWFKPGSEPTEYCNLHEAPEYTEPDIAMPDAVQIDDWLHKAGAKLGKAMRKIFKY
jgi:penicillin-binding protein 1A